ncbi:hypothetical protein U9M48_002900 [Paspalum notatum var. saurae]|uniref:Uncharacterized protein n=1 Tax=Paspalum notatum var. saurae TaxID=547442 RepID=A0AAQ3PGN9_PASNO
MDLPCPCRSTSRLPRRASLPLVRPRRTGHGVGDGACQAVPGAAKSCTRPERFQLENLVRHELEQQSLIEERERMEREYTQKRIIKAHLTLIHGSAVAVVER